MAGGAEQRRNEGAGDQTRSPFHAVRPAVQRAGESPHNIVRCIDKMLEISLDSTRAATISLVP